MERFPWCIPYHWARLKLRVDALRADAAKAVRPGPDRRLLIPATVRGLLGRARD